MASGRPSGSQEPRDQGHPRPPGPALAAPVHQWRGEAGRGGRDDAPRAPLQPVAHLAVEARVALWAGALVGPVAVLAGAAVQAGPRITLVDVVLAVAAREARRTETGEGADAVHAGAAVETGAGGEQAAGEKGEGGVRPCPRSFPRTQTAAEGARQLQQVASSPDDLREAHGSPGRPQHGAGDRPQALTAPYAHFLCLLYESRREEL